jgi:hypothetical protein
MNVIGTLSHEVQLEFDPGDLPTVDQQARNDIANLKSALAQDVIDDAELARRISELEAAQAQDDAREIEVQAESDRLQAQLAALVVEATQDDQDEALQESSIRDLAARVLNVETRPTNPAPSIYDISISDMSGSTSDDKLKNALAAQKADRRRVIRLDYRDNGRVFTQTNNYDPSCPPRIVGPNVGLQNPEQGSAQTVDITVNVGEGANSWFVGSGITFNALFKGFTVRSSNSASQFIHHPYGSGWTCYAGHFSDVTLYGFKHGWGKPGDAFSETLTRHTGEIQFPGIKSTAISLRGADSWYDAMTNLDGILGGGQYHVRLENWSKSHMKNLYLTARDATRNIWNEGMDTGQGGTFISDCIIEGHNAGDPAFGALIVNKSGHLFVSDCAINFGMEAPMDATIDTALVRVLGGQVSLRDIATNKATAVAATVPFAHVSAGALHVGVVLPGTGGARPKVRQTGTGVVNPQVFDLVTV